MAPARVFTPRGMRMEVCLPLQSSPSGLIVGLSLMLEPGSNSVWTICYVVDEKVHMRQEKYNLDGEMIANIKNSFDHWSKTPFALVYDNYNDQVIRFGTDNLAYRGLSSFPVKRLTAFPTIPHGPGQLGPSSRRIAGVDCVPREELRFFVVEEGTINEYILKTGSGNVFPVTRSLAPRGQVRPGSPITGAMWHSQRPRLVSPVLIRYTSSPYSSRN